MSEKIAKTALLKIYEHGGIGAFVGLTMVLTALRISGAIDWAWYWIIGPLWLPPVCIVGSFVVFVICFIGISILAAIWDKLIGKK